MAVDGNSDEERDVVAAAQMARALSALRSELRKLTFTMNFCFPAF